MNVTSAGRKVTVSIVLRRGERECRGEAPGTTTANGVNHAVAEATLHAIEELTEDAVIGRLEHLEVGDDSASVSLVLDVDGVEVAVSAAQRCSPTRVRRSCGPCWKRSSPTCPRNKSRQVALVQRLKASLTFSPACLMSPLACSTSP